MQNFFKLKQMKTKKIIKSFIVLKIAIMTVIFPAYSHSDRQKSNEIKIGSKVPEFILKDQNGKNFDLKSVIGQKNLVIYFYPKDDTPGCTKEACSFRDQYDAFVQANAMVIGISSQSVESHKKFADKYNLPFTLLSDSTNTVRKLFGVQTNENGNIPGRVTFVIDKSGIVQLVFNSNIQPEKHVEEALQILKKM
jgi:thioredoxin-dependent peroxiredoxin